MKNIIAFILALLYSLPTPAQTNNADKMLYLGIIENNQAYVDQAIIDGAYLNRKYNEDTRLWPLPVQQMTIRQFSKA